jgi:hypothetical protein
MQIAEVLAEKTVAAKRCACFGATLIDDPPDILADQAGGLDVAFAVRLRLVGHAKQHAPQAALDNRYADQPFKAGKRQPVSAGDACLLGVEEQR